MRNCNLKISPEPVIARSLPSLSKIELFNDEAISLIQHFVYLRKIAASDGIINRIIKNRLLAMTFLKENLVEN